MDRIVPSKTQRLREATTQADERLMILVDAALARPKHERRAYLERECGVDTALFTEAWKYVEWEERMGDFLLDPVFPGADTDHPLAPGQLLVGRFRMVREIARGGMAVVWEANDEKLKRRVALKFAKAGFGTRLPPEVRHASEISHPNVCKIFEIHTAEGPKGNIDFISMEFLEGETLTERLRYGPLPKEKRLNVALQICAGLAEAHRNGVIHGDLKSNNVILTAGRDGAVRAVITDFGLAQKPGDTGPIVPRKMLAAGTPVYMSPELWKGAKTSVASDIYALGVVFWEMVSGRAPGEVEASSSLIKGNEHPAWNPPPTGSKKCDRILKRCLRADPARRFQSAEAVARALRPSRNRFWFLTAAAALLLALLSGIAVYRFVSAPVKRVHLAVLPFLGDHSAASRNLLQLAATELGQVRNSQTETFGVITPEELERKRIDTPEGARTQLKATHVLRAVLEDEPGAVVVHAYVTDTDSGVNTSEWSEEYKPDEMHYAPAAIAGFVTAAMHLPPIHVATVNAAARSDYAEGLAAVRRDSGVAKALEFFAKAVKADRDSPLTYASLADAQWFEYLATGDKRWLERASQSLAEAEKRNPDVAEVHTVEGAVKADAGWYEPAIAEYLRAIELAPQRCDAYRRLGQAYESNNQLDEALAAFRKAVEVDPQQYRNHRDLGYFYYQRASYEEAVKYFRKALDLAPAEQSTHYNLGVAVMDLGQFDVAERELGISIHLHETAQALHALGLVLMYERRDRKAIPNIMRALKIGPENYLWWMNAGTAYRRAGFATESRDAYARGLDLAESEMARNPRSGNVRAHLAFLCAELGNTSRASSEIAQALRLSPNDSDTRFMATITYDALGRSTDAISVLTASPTGVLADVSRWPDVADLHEDPRFLRLLASRLGK